jgi:hypothetical protein
MSKTLQQVMRVINTQQGHLKRVARKIDALRKKKELPQDAKEALSALYTPNAKLDADLTIRSTRRSHPRQEGQLCCPNGPSKGADR